MKNALSQMATSLNSVRKKRKGWKKVVSVLASVVVFCTTYALILPAITMEKEAICGFEEHEHLESCFEKHIAYSLQCISQMTDDTVVHSHNEICYDADGNLICTLPEVIEHSHGAKCIDDSGNLICTLPEISIHNHEDACYEVSQDLVCTLPEVTVHTHESNCYEEHGKLICSLMETEGHTHSDACYTEKSELICELAETQGHEHGEGCYKSEHCLCCGLEEIESHTHAENCYKKEHTLVCTLKEVIEHKHEESCYGPEGSLICDLPEVTAHTHGDACYEMQKHLVCERLIVNEHVHIKECLVEESESILVCQIPVHIHGDACFEEPETEEKNGFLCASGEHTHGDACYNAEGVLSCTIPEHVHDAACIEELIDLTADVETQEQWENTMSQLTLTGNWPTDLLAVAKTQMGYKESVKNLILENGVLQGYTRFGAWYGIPYGDWDAMFVSFCLNYAGVPESVISWENNGQRWMDNLQNSGLLDNMETHTPKEGDLLFYDRHNGTAIGVGIVTAVEMQENAETGVEEVKQITILTGDVEDKVAEKNVLPGSVKSVLDVKKAQQVYEGTYVAETEQDKDIETEIKTEIKTQTAETENYIVTVTYSSDLVLPEGAELKVLEYAKDSEVFKQRCKEAGYELEWLLNIGFFVGDTELDLDGRFDVTITGKQGDEIAGDVTHFADDGMERINGTKKVDDTQTSLTFLSRGFSDFGGGVVTIAETGHEETGMATISFNFTCSNTGGQIISTMHQYPVGSIVTINVNSSENVSGNPTINIDGVTLVSQKYTNNKTYTIVLEIISETASVTGSFPGVQKREWWGSYWANPWTGISVTYEYHPHAVHTGDIKINRLRFYNLCESENGISALPGCVFEITGNNGYSATITSGNSSEVNLPKDIPNGTYTITEISVPDGYMRDTNYQRTFTVEGGAFVGDKSIGTYINHHMEKLESDKTAEVEDYNNRIYQILLSAKSKMQMYQLGPIDVLFVVDQSNSMLFPSGLNPTGKEVRLHLENGGYNTYNMDQLNLDKSKMYYLIADPEGTSTVFCVWHDGNAWMYQDASYYAKAKHNNAEGYKDPNETAIFPSNRSFNEQKDAEANTGTKSNGGGLGHNLSGSKLGDYIRDYGYNGENQVFQLYTANDEFNRLHYLEEAIVNMIYELADANPQNRVAITEFTKEVKTDCSDCKGPLELTPENTQDLVYEVTNINTGGGTRQDIALKHVYEKHLNAGNTYDKDVDYTYTILITDGAPVRSGSNAPALGNQNSSASTDANAPIYGQIKGWANQVKTKSTLMTVGLGMESVEAGKSVLQQIASDGSFYCALDDASELVRQMQLLLFESMKPIGNIDISGELVDEITDSFYPIAWVDKGYEPEEPHMFLSLRESPYQDGSKDWILLKEGDWITLDGKYTTGADAAGQLLQKEDGTFYIKWMKQNLSDWNGTFYVKAKEDFIGGNAIDTNKSASITVNGATKKFEIPTVNVRLIDMNEMNSEVTVYLGDIINEHGNSPLDSLKYFYENTKFAKLISDGGDVLNTVSVGSGQADGLENAVFYLRYAMGRDLNENEWTRLMNAQTVTLPYTYDDASSHGAVGYFSFRLEKKGIEGSNPDFEEHEATVACQPNGLPLTENCNKPAETYTLHIVYRAYELGESGRPTSNVYNGTGSPGTEVGMGRTLETGLGAVDKQNVHEVHVISGKIEIFKKFAEGTISDVAQTFTFILHRVEDGEDTSGDITKTITIPANASVGSTVAIFDNLHRGTYKITEAVNDKYTIESIVVLSATNCFSTPSVGESANELTFVMGSNLLNENVIGKIDDAVYTGYIDSPNGVYGVAEFINTEIIYTGEIPVTKLWGDEVDHSNDEVYLVLYENGNLVLDKDSRARILKLDALNNWNGKFVVVLNSKDDKVTNYKYSVKEVSRVSVENKSGWHSSILENDGSVIFYETTLESGSMNQINERYYMVQYETGVNGEWIVKNFPAMELPKTGGMGSHIYTVIGLVLILVVFGYVYLQKNIIRKPK